MPDPFYIFIGVLLILVILRHLWQNRSEPKDWYIGPLVQGKNYSKGVELVKASNTIWSVLIDKGDELDGITKAKTPLTNGIKIRYEIMGGPLHATEVEISEPILTLYIARKGNKWSMKGADEFNRWYSTKPLLLTEGVHEYFIPFDPSEWHGVSGIGAKDAVAEFQAALKDEGRIGLGFGYWGGRMHGVGSNSPVIFDLIEWNAD